MDDMIVKQPQFNDLTFSTVNFPVRCVRIHQEMPNHPIHNDVIRVEVNCIPQLIEKLEQVYKEFTSTYGSK